MPCSSSLRSSSPRAYEATSPSLSQARFSSVWARWVWRRAACQVRASLSWLVMRARPVVHDRLHRQGIVRVRSLLESSAKRGVHPSLSQARFSSVWARWVWRRAACRVRASLARLVMRARPVVHELVVLLWQYCRHELLANFQAQFQAQLPNGVRAGPALAFAPYLRFASQFPSTLLATRTPSRSYSPCATLLVGVVGRDMFANISRPMLSTFSST